MDLIELQLRLSQTILRYRLIFHPVKHYAPAVIHEDEDVTVSTIVLNHRVPCTGFLFREKPRPLKLRINKIREYKIPLSWYNDIKSGADFVDGNGVHIPNSELTVPRGKTRSFAFCSDTIYDEQLADVVQGVDLLYHESTFTHDLSERARITYHSTAKQAAQIAAMAGVGKLIIGHFSARYKDLTPLLDEAVEVFPNTELGIEGKSFAVKSDAPAE
jgi:ribonuclease Z